MVDHTVPITRTGNRPDSLRALIWPAKAQLTPKQPPTTVVLLHGLGDTADIWRSMMSELSLPFSTIAFDLPGHGRSPKLASEQYRVPILADHVARALVEHGADHPILVGHSLGARVTVELAISAPRLIAGAILVDMGTEDESPAADIIADHIDTIAAGSPTLEGLLEIYRDRLPLADEDALADAVAAMAASSHGKWRVPLDPAIKRLIAPGEPGRFWQHLANLQIPTAIIRGAISGVLSRSAAERMATTIPGCRGRLSTVPMTGHAIPLEQPKNLAEIVANYAMSFAQL